MRNSLLRFAVSIGILAAALGATIAQASIIPIGSNYTIAGTNAPTTFGTTTLAFDQTSKLVAGGQLLVTETQIADGPNAEWNIFSVSRVGGGPLAGNINAYWDLSWGFLLSAPVLFDATTIWWTVDGEADPTINNWALCCVGPNQINPSFGQAFNNNFPGAPFDGFVTFTPTIFVNPYNFVSAGGIDPNTANDFHFAFHFTLQNPVDVPEPTVLALFGTGLLCLGVLRRRRVA
jgi:hypothetical protein